MSRRPKTGAGSSDPIGEIGAGFEGLMSALGAVVSEISERLEAGEAREVHKSFEWDTGKGPVRAEAGFRMRFADQVHGGRDAGERRVAEPVNTATSRTKAADPNPPQPPARPIDFEIVVDGNAWRLNADIPGVEESELRLSEDAGMLVIETTGARRYACRCPMPEGVRADALSVSLRNGILELATPGGEGA